jgi:hypothetical protein
MKRQAKSLRHRPPNGNDEERKSAARRMANYKVLRCVGVHAEAMELK